MAHVPAVMWKRAEELMRERRLMSAEELDEELAALAKDVPQDATTGTGRNRRENLVDWVKATWTKKGAARKVELNGETCYLWWPTAGEVNGISLMSRDEANDSLTAVLEAVALSVSQRA